MDSVALLWIMAGVWGAIQLSKWLRAVWRDDFGDPWYRRYQTQGRHRMTKEQAREHRAFQVAQQDRWWEVHYGQYGRNWHYIRRLWI